jgi:hypothetical protein
LLMNNMICVAIRPAVFARELVPARFHVQKVPAAPRLCFCDVEPKLRDKIRTCDVISKQRERGSVCARVCVCVCEINVIGTGNQPRAVGSRCSRAAPSYLKPNQLLAKELKDNIPTIGDSVIIPRPSYAWFPFTPCPTSAPKYVQIHA